MSEKIYALLLRLHARAFREAYGEEAMQLFRDRWRDETGMIRRARLIVDLALDFAVAVPRGYAWGQRGAMRAPAVAGEAAMFALLPEARIDRRALALGVALSIAGLGAAGTLVRQAANLPAPRDRGLAALLWRRDLPPATTNAAFQAAQPARASEAIDADERERVVRGAADAVKASYFDRVAGEKVAAALLEREARGDFNFAKDGATLAAMLKDVLVKLSGDPHLDMLYSVTPLAVQLPASTPAFQERYREAMERENCTFEHVEVLDGNVGYFKLNAFPETAVCGGMARAAMQKLNGVRRLIFDLRDNGGGYGDMTALLAGYLFTHKEYWFNPREDTTAASWIEAPAAGSRLMDKPVYVLTSGRTASAAEAFSYNLKMLRRATLVGETTRGAAHAATMHRLDDHFAIFVQETHPVNPYSDRDWEGVGVAPDVRVKAEDALTKARELAKY